MRLERILLAVRRMKVEPRARDCAPAEPIQGMFGFSLQARRPSAGKLWMFSSKPAACKQCPWPQSDGRSSLTLVEVISVEAPVDALR